ncbi:terminase small subunit [Peribacillus asahii]|uniref:terminase small subunit n=1 Tax=Peribacillus asahii TaxID=228899 RepID=UPI00382D311A
MARKRDPRRDEAFEIWKQHNGEITNRAIAEQLDVPEKTIGGWKSKDKWNDKLNGVLQTKIRSTPKEKPAKKARAPNDKEAEEPIVESGELTDKQRLFCMYYVKYFNATKAYQKAYECDYFTANANGSRLLVKASIKSEIERMKKDLADGLMLDASAVLQKYIDIAFADITDFVDFGQEKRPELDHNLEPMIDENGDEVTYSFSYVNLKNHDEVDGTLITEVKKGKDGVSIKLADKMKALEFLSKYTDLLNDNEKKRLQEEKLRADIAKTQSEVKGAAKANIQTTNMSNLTTEELRAIANAKRGRT